MDDETINEINPAQHRTEVNIYCSLMNTAKHLSFHTLPQTDSAPGQSRLHPAHSPLTGAHPAVHTMNRRTLSWADCGGLTVCPMKCA
jgi:hypothetical protein